MKQPDHMENRDIHLLAEIQVSGEEIQIGSYCHTQGDSVWIKTRENAEEIHLSVTEVDLFVAALRVAQANINEG